MNSIHIFVKELNTPSRYVIISYVCALILYNASGSFIDAKKHLIKFRERDKQIKSDWQYEIKSEWEAVKYGAKVNSSQRLWDSIIWPITLTNNFVPWLVLNLYRK